MEEDEEEVEDKQDDVEEEDETGLNVSGDSELLRSAEKPWSVPALLFFLSNEEKENIVELWHMDNTIIVKTS